MVFALEEFKVQAAVKFYGIGCFSCCVAVCRGVNDPLKANKSNALPLITIKYIQFSDISSFRIFYYHFACTFYDRNNDILIIYILCVVFSVLYLENKLFSSYT